MKKEKVFGLFLIALATFLLIGTMFAVTDWQTAVVAYGVAGAFIYLFFYGIKCMRKG